MAEKKPGVTRRAIAGLLTAAPLAAQAPAPAPESIESARDSQKRNSEAIRKLRVPLATEPAFSFRP